MQRDGAAEQGAAKPATHAGANLLPAPPYEVVNVRCAHGERDINGVEHAFS
jgi:hypothetical protein